MKYISKQAFLSLMRSRYAPFDDFLQHLEKGLLTTPGVNDDWSVKDHIAHLAFWEKQTLITLQYIREHGEEPVDPFEGLSEDESNERIYQESKDRSLQEVWNTFHTASTALVTYVETLTEEQINRPLTSKRSHALWAWVIGQTFGHYIDHTHIILEWLYK